MLLAIEGCRGDAELTAQSVSAPDREKAGSVSSPFRAAVSSLALLVDLRPRVDGTVAERWSATRVGHRSSSSREN